VGVGVSVGGGVLVGCGVSLGAGVKVAVGCGVWVAVGGEVGMASGGAVGVGVAVVAQLDRPIIKITANNDCSGVLCFIIHVSSLSRTLNGGKCSNQSSPLSNLHFITTKFGIFI
jgi:hypothetical protein